MLPFEGDNLLSIILSKALRLAADDEIADAPVLRQIRSCLNLNFGHRAQGLAASKSRPRFLRGSDQ
jgi:hypothetical protein